MLYKVGHGFRCSNRTLQIISFLCWLSNGALLIFLYFLFYLNNFINPLVFTTVLKVLYFFSIFRSSPSDILILKCFQFSFLLNRLSSNDSWILELCGVFQKSRNVLIFAIFQCTLILTLICIFFYFWLNRKPRVRNLIVQLFSFHFFHF